MLVEKIEICTNQPNKLGQVPEKLCNCHKELLRNAFKFKQKSFSG